MQTYTFICYHIVYNCMQLNEMGESEMTSNNTQMHHEKVRSIHGQALFFCRACNTEVRVSEHVTGITRELTETYYWDYAVGACGHTVKDWSY